MFRDDVSCSVLFYTVCGSCGPASQREDKGQSAHSSARLVPATCTLILTVPQYWRVERNDFDLRTRWYLRGDGESFLTLGG